MLEELKTE